MVSPLIFITLNTVLYLGAFLLLVVGFSTTQWAIHVSNCGCSGDCIFYIGLFRSHYTELGKCSEKSKDVDCNDFNLNDDNCNYYESSREAAQLALALVVILLVWKIIVNIISFTSLQQRKRILWILFLLATIGDIIVGFCAFISAGQFDAIDDWNVVNVSTGKQVSFDQGYGWQCFIGGGGVAWIVAILGGFTLWQGFGNSEESPVAAPLDGNTK